MLIHVEVDYPVRKVPNQSCLIPHAPVEGNPELNAGLLAEYDLLSGRTKQSAGCQTKCRPSMDGSITCQLKKKKKAQLRSLELSFMWGKMRTIAQVAALQIKKKKTIQRDGRGG